jgi:hypothetical protein
MPTLKYVHVKPNADVEYYSGNTELHFIISTRHPHRVVRTQVGDNTLSKVSECVFDTREKLEAYLNDGQRIANRPNVAAHDRANGIMSRVVVLDGTNSGRTSFNEIENRYDIIPMSESAANEWVVDLASTP